MFNFRGGGGFKSSHPWPKVWLSQTELDLFFEKRVREILKGFLKKIKFWIHKNIF